MACPPQHYYDDDRRAYVPYVVIEVTGPNATRSLLDFYELDTTSTAYRQKRHPLDSFRRAGFDGGSVLAVKQAHQKPHRMKVHRVVSSHANVGDVKGRGWRKMTREHPNAIPCPSCPDGFVTPGFARKRYTNCPECRRTPGAKAVA